jgi:hypothetical protein
VPRAPIENAHLIRVAPFTRIQFLVIAAKQRWNVVATYG